MPTKQASYNFDTNTVQTLDRFIQTEGERYGIYSRRTAVEAMIENLYVRLGGKPEKRVYPDMPFITDTVEFSKTHITFPQDERYVSMMRYIQKKHRVATKTDLVEKLLKIISEVESEGSL
jgi:hypothetical protein